MLDLQCGLCKKELAICDNFPCEAARCNFCGSCIRSWICKQSSINTRVACPTCSDHIHPDAVIEACTRQIERKRAPGAYEKREYVEEADRLYLSAIPTPCPGCLRPCIRDGGCPLLTCPFCSTAFKAKKQSRSY